MSDQDYGGTSVYSAGSRRGAIRAEYGGWTMKSTRTLLGATLIVAVAAAGAFDVRAQQRLPHPTSVAKTVAWTPPLTPWGDPDLQGYYTNKYEYETPFERPTEFEGRRLEDVSPQELADAMKKRQQRALDRAPFFGGDPEGKIGNSAEFRDIYEVTKGSRAWFVVDPPDGKIPAMLPEARARIAAQPRSGSSFGTGPFNGPEDFGLWDRCITRGLPGSMLPGGYGNSYQIVQGPGLVAIRYEMVHDTRVIPLEGGPHVGSAIRMEMGDARGRWDGSTLVVETRRFKQRSAYRNANADTLRLVERFTRTAPDRIEWSVTVDDPQTWTRPWTFAIPLTMNDSEPVAQYECHEGNQAIRNILSAARAKERQVDK